MFWGTPETEEEIEEGQFLDTPLVIVEKDKDGDCIIAPSGIIHSRWAISPFTPEEQHSSSYWQQPKACKDGVDNGVHAQLENCERTLGSLLEPQGFMLQEKGFGCNPKFYKGESYSKKDFFKSTRAIDGFTKYRFVDEYEKLNKIGHGSYGIVYRACDKKTREIVALKKFSTKEGKEDPNSLMEFQILSSIHHPSIIEVKEVVVNNSLSPTKFMVMEYIEHDLKGLMEKSMVQPFSQSEVKCLMLQLFDGVKFLHDNGVVHRDLKPSNLLLNNCGELKICDFGMAKWFGSQPLKHIHEIVTLSYKAPELLFGAKEYSIAIDMWSLGCIMAELLTKKPLFLGQSRFDQINKICKVLGTPNRKIWPNFVNLLQVPSNMINQPFNKLREHFPSMAFVAKPTLTQKGFDLLN